MSIIEEQGYVGYIMGHFSVRWSWDHRAKFSRRNDVAYHHRRSQEDIPMTGKYQKSFFDLLLYHTTLDLAREVTKKKGKAGLEKD
jgi:hypothetical protein